MSMKMRTGIVALLAVILIIIIALFNGRAGTDNSKQVVTATVAYSCDGGNAIVAAYLPGETTAPAGPGLPPTPGGSVALVLSDGRTMTLRQTISADGTRYANDDESFVFWSKGNGAIVQENGQESAFTNCLEATGTPAL